MRLSIKSKLFYSHFVAVVLVSGSIGTFFYTSAVSSLFASLQARLKYSAALLSRTMDADVLADIKAPSDTDNPGYREHLKLLRDFQGANQDISFIYVMRLEAGKVYFVIDSDTSPAQALPGREYDASNLPKLREGFTGLAADDAITRDEWGYFLSGYAPLKNGAGRYLVGLDMRADEVHHKFQRIRIAGLVSLGLSLLFAFLCSRFLAARITRPIKLLASRSSEIAQGVLGGTVTVATGDELDDLAASFNSMSVRLEASHQETQHVLAALAEANEGLEARVVERTSRLAEVNTQLMQEVAERTRAEQALAKAATTDYLTGLLNRPAMLRLLEHEAERVHRGCEAFALLLADLDSFKPINDTFGHEVGDEVLIHTAHLLRQSVRGQDAIARWGGDELLIFLPETPLAGAVAVAEKLRARIAEAPYQAEGAVHRITLSLGVSALAQGMSISDCIRYADVALYRAKAEGRNRVVPA